MGFHESYDSRRCRRGGAVAALEHTARGEGESIGDGRTGTGARRGKRNPQQGIAGLMGHVYNYTAKL